MKKVISLLALILIIILLLLPVGCVRVDIGEDSGTMVTREYDFTGFTNIEIGDAFKVDITRSDDYSVNVTISENIVERLSVTMDRDTLKIELKGVFFNIHSSPQVTITLPDLYGLDLSGASHGDAREFVSSHDFNLNLSGASSLDIDMVAGDFEAEISGASHLSGYLKVASSDIELSGASRITLNGAGGDLRLDISGASTGNLDDYAVGNVDIELSGASNASLDISGRLDADLSGASRLVYRGEPILGSLSISGGSSLKPK